MELIESVGLQIFLETREVEKGETWTSEGASGLWFGTLTKGRLKIGLKGSGFQELSELKELSENTDIRYWSEKPMETIHEITQTGTMSAMFIHVEPDILKNMLSKNDLKLFKQKGLLPKIATISKFCKTLTWQMFGCQYTGTERELYIAGKALEYISHAITETSNEIGIPLTQTSNNNYSSKEVECFHDACSIILSDLRSPPTVPALALQVGLNSRKLGQGFTDLFGKTVYSYIKEQRLEHARLLIDSGVVTSVSEAANAVGYNSAHFSTEFRRFYGVSPSDVL